MNKKRLCTMLLAVAITTPLIGDVVASADTKSQNQINANKEKINELEKEKEDLKNEKDEEVQKLSKVMKEIEEMTKNLDKYQSVVDEYQKKIDSITSEINALENRMAEMQRQIDKTEADIQKNEEEKAKREQILGERLSSYYKMDFQAQFLHMLFSSENIGDFFSTLFNIDKILKTDKQLITEIQELNVQLENEKKSIIENRTKVEEDKKRVEESRAEEQKLQDKAIVERNKWQAQVDDLEKIENEKRDILSKLENKEKSIENQIGDLMDFNKELQQKIDGIFDNIGNQGGIAPSSSGFIRPSGYDISSNYGPRKHPVTGNPNGFHTGTDFAAPYGATTMAANSGTVVYSGWMSGYGQTIVIDHGGGVQTLYAHSSSLLVSNGQKVQRGQAIAKVGSTGMSTGPHLHFEVRINGRHTNPMNYIS